MNIAEVPTARTAADVDAAAGVREVALAAAAAAAELVPSAMALTAVPTDHTDVPRDATALVASFVGSPSAEIALVAADVVQEALLSAAAAGTPLGLADALRPALEAAAAVLGAGVLEPGRSEPVAGVLGPDTQVVALQQGGVTTAWFALRLRGPRVTAPAAPAAPRASLRMLYDVEMTLTAEIGRTRLPVRQVLELAPGAVLELDRTAGSPADVMVNGRLVARGEVVVVDEAYGIRVTEIVPGTEPGL
ncbi:flagellar motor switch protein FliN [Cellulomonas fengjieae]|uniref:Flagellar motor switch protein FliN n=1 Tax=Cellulomonas fengjieae TaxID=2819978 RepID=A0ABS3SGR2_9CELL|nr:flagellar motor switch protein FliN [Cellulomonas fengjieae]MBO3084924.1 flagellar motor switch protein FliN [Cellulomonas fengjieae]MBO3100671.1 flagellar motor switch protein FliN [Cellulomonas fengjieae]QVI66474.1 flagellar motor switch protein FliN [Cellulomonas fengjieae]